MVLGMKSVYTCLEKVFKRGTWKYYQNKYNGDFPICSKEESERFINEYFKAGSKEAILSGITLKNSENSEF